MSTSSNAILARWAREALKEYDRVSGGGVSEAALIPMLIASLLHLSEQRQLDTTRVMQAARELYTGETQAT